ncbi:glycosyltransferase [uncultured Eudoraea sp.]|uniref:glycosyltransferase n=1 Tax=uncultured Eudoraea sp. TaxID=1035614 RepID=UPI0026272CED|nr:glycosyltransferase [uncultured Eudoraea sp.]
MKILLAVDSLARGGMERRLIELVKGLKRYPEIELNLVVFSETIAYPEIHDLDIPITILKRVPKKNPMVFVRFYKLCKKLGPDLIHCWGTMSAIWAIPTAKLLGISLINGNIMDAPEGLSFFDKRLFRARLTYPFSSFIVSNSKAGLNAYKVPKHKAICIYNGFDSNRISNLKQGSELKNELKVQTPKVVGMIGSFSERKDFETFIKAGIKILGKRSDVTFLAVGEGPELGKHLQMVPSKYRSNFIFPGIRTDVESVINILDIGVLSTNSHIHGEGISNVILEYMALEKPVIATKGGGTPEIIEHGISGILIPSHSALDLANEIHYLLENIEEARTMGRKGRETVAEKFNLAEMTKAYIELYQRTY